MSDTYPVIVCSPMGNLVIYEAYKDACKERDEALARVAELEAECADYKDRWLTAAYERDDWERKGIDARCDNRRLGMEEMLLHSDLCGAQDAAADYHAAWQDAEERVRDLFRFRSGIENKEIASILSQLEASRADLDAMTKQRDTVARELSRVSNLLGRTEARIDDLARRGDRNWAELEGASLQAQTRCGELEAELRAVRIDRDNLLRERDGLKANNRQWQRAYAELERRVKQERDGRVGFELSCRERLGQELDEVRTDRDNLLRDRDAAQAALRVLQALSVRQKTRVDELTAHRDQLRQDFDECSADRAAAIADCRDACRALTMERAAHQVTAKRLEDARKVARRQYRLARRYHLQEYGPVDNEIAYGSLVEDHSWLEGAE